MSRPVIWFRAFNALLGQVVSIWSIGMAIAPGILSLIITGFFASSLIVPLSIVCAIVGAIGLLWGGFTGYWRYQYLTSEADKLLNRYHLKWQDKLDYPNSKDNLQSDPDIPLNTVILVRNENNEQTVAYFKRCIAGDYVVITVDVDLTSQEEEIFSTEKMSAALEETARRSIINGILGRVLSARGNVPILQQADKLTKEQQNIIFWEKINAFFSDAPTAFAFSSIIIFLISHVFFGVLIPATLLIAVAVSIAYGVFSMFIRDAQVDSKLKTMQAFKDEYEAIKAKLDTFMAKANEYINKASDFIEKNQSEDSQEILEIQENKKAVEQQMENLSLSQAKLVEIYNKSHRGFTDKEIFRVIYASFYGEIVAGTFIYVVLPLVISALGLAPLSLPILIGIVAAVALLYGLYNMYHKREIIKHEKWIMMDDQEIKQIRESFEEIKLEELDKSVQTIVDREEQLVNTQQALNLDLSDEPAPEQHSQQVIDQVKEEQSIIKGATAQYNSFTEEVNKFYWSVFPKPSALIELQEVSNFELGSTSDSDTLELNQ